VTVKFVFIDHMLVSFTGYRIPNSNYSCCVLSSPGDAHSSFQIFEQTFVDNSRPEHD